MPTIYHGKRPRMVLLFEFRRIQDTLKPRSEYIPLINRLLNLKFKKHGRYY